MAKKVQIQLVRSTICCKPWMRTIVRTMGLRKLNQKRVMEDNGSIRGMVRKVPHLVTLTEVKE